MSEEIIVRFKWTADGLRTGMKCHYRAQYPRMVHIVFWGFLYLTIVGGGCATFVLGVDGGGFPVLLYGLSALFFFRILNPWILRHQFSKRPDHDAEIEWRLSEEGVKSKTPNGTSEQNWAAFAKVVQTQSGFLFYPTSRIFHWLPRAGFASDSDFERLSELAGKKARCFKRVV